jgi:tRNA threonylcarbamoyladenosine biosynthesis protein TsaE
MEKTVHSLAEFEAEAAAFAAGLPPRKEGATLVTLSGELGAGKTAFTKAAAKAFGITEEVTSPTFLIMKSYALPEGAAFRTLAHIDAYRLGSGADLSPLKFDAVLADPGTLVMLEWPERVADVLPAPAVRISIEPSADGSRTIAYA